MVSGRARKDTCCMGWVGDLLRKNRDSTETHGHTDPWQLGDLTEGVDDLGLDIGNLLECEQGGYKRRQCASHSIWLCNGSLTMVPSRAKRKTVERTDA